MIKLAVFDVDGTLLAKGEKQLRESTVKALTKLKENGVKLAIASGRPPFLMNEDLLKQVDFDYFICVNGAYVADKTHKELTRTPLSMEITNRLIEDFTKHDDALLFQFEDAAYVYHGNKRMSAMISEWIGRLDILRDEREGKKRHLKSLPLGGVSHIHPDNLPIYEKHYPNLIFESFAENYYDIHEKDHSKADGVEYLCKVLDYKMSEVVSFGDNFNDLEMIKESGIGVAMGNAVDELKAISNYVTTPSDEDGIYHACVHLNLI